MIAIDKKVPMPPPHASKQKYPFETMEVGDSFAVPHSVQLGPAAHAWAKRHPGVKFSVRKVPEGKRCWRVT